jgi:hypothetical protein
MGIRSGLKNHTPQSAIRHFFATQIEGEKCFRSTSDVRMKVQDNYSPTDFAPSPVERQFKSSHVVANELSRPLSPSVHALVPVGAHLVL